MNKKELLECLKNLSTTNNKRDGIDIKKEEAQLIIEIINKLTAESTEWEERTYYWQDRAENLQIVLDKVKETINYYATEDEDYSKIYNQEEQEIMKLLEEIK